MPEAKTLSLPKHITIAAPEKPQTEAPKFLEEANAFAVKSAEDSQFAQRARAEINAEIKRLNDKRFELTRPLDKIKADIMSLFSAPITTLQAALRLYDRKILDYNQERERLRRAEQAKLDAQARAERERLQKIADAAAAKGQEGKAEIFQERAAAVVAPILQKEPPRAAGVSFRKVWAFRIKNPDKINAPFMAPDEVKIGKLVRSMGLEAAPIIGEGVEIFEQESIASRSSKETGIE